MPRGDRTGPSGYGSMTGRAAGFSCRGGGRSYRNRYYATGLYGWQRDMTFQAPSPYAPPPYAPPPYAAQQISPQDEVQALREQVKYMEDGIKATQQRISEIEEHKAQE